MAKKSLFKTFFKDLRANLTSEEQIPVVETSLSTEPEPKLLFFIVDWYQAQIASDILVAEHVRFHFLSKGMGTANSEILDLLGLGTGEKALVLCLEEASRIPLIIKEVRKILKFATPRASTRIAFTIPLSAINDPLLLLFKQNTNIYGTIAAMTANAGPQGEGGKMEKEFSHDLIVAIVNQGYSDDLVNTAREAGASGGTVINARGQAHEGAVKFFGVSVQDEKELILLLTSRAKKLPIMRAISETHGLNSKAHGIVFSLPVDSVTGVTLE